MSAWDRQVGGTHYKDYAIQPAEYCQKNRLNMLESAIIKYATRHSHKHGKEDIDKIIHCAEMIKEMEYPEEESPQAEMFEDERISGSSHGVTFKTKDGEYYTVMDQRA